MKLNEFKVLASYCIVCGSKTKYSTNKAYVDDKPFSRENYYFINIQCTRAERCFGYMSNVVSTHDPIEVKKFYMSFPKIQIFSVVDEFTQVMANGQTMKLPYIPFESWLRAKGQILEKIEKLLLLADGKSK